MAHLFALPKSATAMFYKSEKTFVKQADSAQNKRTANEVESFKIKMFQTKDGLFFCRTRFFHGRPMLATSPTAFGEHYSVSAAGVP